MFCFHCSAQYFYETILNYQWRALGYSIMQELAFWIKKLLSSNTPWSDVYGEEVMSFIAPLSFNLPDGD